MKKLISAAVIAAMVLPQAVMPVSVSAAKNTETISYTYSAGEGKTYTREMERLGRGLVAIKNGSDVYLSWRLLDSEDNIFGSADSNVSFNVYNGSVKIAEVTDKTNYTISGGDINATYSVAPVVDGVEGEKESSIRNMSNNYFDIDISKYKPEGLSLPRTVSLKPSNSNSSYNYFVNTDAPANIPNGSSYDTYAEYVVSSWRDSTAAWKYYDYTINDCSVGDLDGDGEYEIIVKWDCNGQDNSLGGVTGPVYLDAYNLDGEQLWRIDLGRNIRAGAHYTQFLVYDFDLDGKAELACKTAPGSKDSTGAYVTAVSHISSIRNVSDTINQTDYVNDDGRVLDGAEYYTIFDCEGKAVDTIEYPNLRGNISRWGNNESYGNRVDRFLGTVAYIDGVRPYMISLRGYYDKTTVAAIKYENGELSVAKNFVAESGTENAGQGNHNMTVADVDNDGKDEFMTGSICWDDDLSVLWNGKRGHGDALHIGDYDPTHKGFEYFTVQEASPYGMTVYDPQTGETLYHEDASADTGRGVMANIGMGGYYQIWSSKNGLQISNGGTSYTAGNKNGLSQNFRIFWDGDLYDELLDGTNITSWNGSGVSTIFTASGCTSVNGTKANPALQADIFGDWREEVIYPTSDNNALRIFSTTTPSDYKIKTLMHDPVYRSGVATEQTGYNQPPHVGMYIDEEVLMGEPISIKAANTKTQYNVGDELDKSALTVTASYESGKETEITGYKISGYNPLITGEQTVTVSYGGMTDAFNVTVSTAFQIDENGYITGYTGNNATETLPVMINGKAVKGIADNVLNNTSISSLYVYDDPISFGTNSISGIKLICFEDSDTHKYAVANGISYELMQPGKYYINEIFDDSKYENFSSGDAIVYQHGKQAWTTEIAPINYGVGARSNNDGGDNNTGVYIRRDLSRNKKLEVRAGQFATGNRHAYAMLNSKSILEGLDEYTFEFDFSIPSNSNEMTIAILSSEDGKFADSSTSNTYISDKNTIYALQAERDGIVGDEEYHYELKYENGTYSQTVTNNSTGAVLKPSLNKQAAPLSLAFPSMSGSRNSYASAYLDNIVLSSPMISTLMLRITDSVGTEVPNASVTLNGETKTADANGNVTFEVTAGKYDVEITADELEDYNTTVMAYTETQTKTIAMDSHYPFQYTETPVITVTDLSVGKQVSISCATPGAKIYYITTNSDEVPNYHNDVYTSPFIVYESTTVKAIAVKENMEDSAVASKAISIATPYAVTPVITVTTTDSGKEIDMSTATEGASIYYTTDGTAPTTASSLFTDTITLTDSAIIKAVAVKAGYANSAVTSAKIAFEKAATPTSDTAAGSVVAGTLISLSTETYGADIYYTTDGSDPATSSSTLDYSGSIPVTDTTTIKAVAIKNGYKTSDVFTADYTVTPLEDGKVTISVGTAEVKDNIASVPVCIYMSHNTAWDLIDRIDFEIGYPYALQACPKKVTAGRNQVTCRDFEVIDIIYYEYSDAGEDVFYLEFEVPNGIKDGEYPLTIDPDSISFDTDNIDVEVQNGAIIVANVQSDNKINTILTDSNGNDITTGANLSEVTANVIVEETQFDENDEEYYTPKNVILAIYDTNGALVKLNNELLYLNNNSVQSHTVKIPDNTNVGSIKMFVWDGLGSMTPLCEAIPLLGE